jgi:hypothetical protein
VYTEFYKGKLKRRHHVKDLEVDGRTLLKLILKKMSGRMWNGLIKLRIGASGGLL